MSSFIPGCRDENDLVSSHPGWISSLPGWASSRNRLQFYCLRCSNKMARKQFVLTFAAIEISFCLVTVLLQLQSVLLFHQRIVSSRGEKRRVFTWNFHLEKTVYMEISSPGRNLVPVLGTGMSSTRNELIPSPNHVNSKACFTLAT